MSVKADFGTLLYLNGLHLTKLVVAKSEAMASCGCINSAKKYLLYYLYLLKLFVSPYISGKNVGKTWRL